MRTSPVRQDTLFVGTQRRRVIPFHWSRFVVLAVIALPHTLRAQAIDWKSVETAIGRPGAAQPADVYRFNFPRTDLRVVVGTVTLRPALALGGWIAMKAAPEGVMAVGDLVLTEAEVAPVINVLQKGGVEQTAIHHHLVNESPRVIYVHVHGHGDAVALAATIRAAVATTKIPPAVRAVPTPLELDTLAVARALGYRGRANGGAYQVSVPRAEAIREAGFEFPPSMGVATAINFQPTGSGRAAIAGDFVLLAGEVNPVIRALQQGGIQVTSLHNHMLAEEPRFLFMHFWANADAVSLAKTLRSALDLTNSKRPSP